LGIDTTFHARDNDIEAGANVLEGSALLYHFSENPEIAVFEPHRAATSSIDDALVWAVDAAHEYLYLFPRDCPRVCFRALPESDPAEVERFLGLSDAYAVVAIESRWLERMRASRLFRYEFADEGFDLHDANAGYWVARRTIVPVKVEPVGDLLDAQMRLGVELRIMPSLVALHDAIVNTTLEWSMIRWRNAVV
jgi:hypothetical protein